jgi:hypothetical protein
MSVAHKFFSLSLVLIGALAGCGGGDSDGPVASINNSSPFPTQAPPLSAFAGNWTSPRCTAAPTLVKTGTSTTLFVKVFYARIMTSGSPTAPTGITSEIGFGVHAKPDCSDTKIATLAIDSEFKKDGITTLADGAAAIQFTRQRLPQTSPKKVGTNFELSPTVTLLDPNQLFSKVYVTKEILTIKDRQLYSGDVKSAAPNQYPTQFSAEPDLQLQ